MNDTPNQCPVDEQEVTGQEQAGQDLDSINVATDNKQLNEDK